MDSAAHGTRDLPKGLAENAYHLHMIVTPTVALPWSADVGEGPVWDSQHERLLWVDITAGEVHAFDPATQTDTILVTCDQPVGAVAPASNGELVLALGGSIAAFNEESQTIRELAEVERNPDFRCNDAGVDPQGRFVVGTMGYEPAPGTADLFRREIDGSITTLIRGVGLSNGMGWSSDGATFYFVESLSREIRCYDYTSDQLGDPMFVITVPADAGTPDGLTIDADGNLWVALWGGGAVWQLTPQGTHLQTITLPVSQVTSVGFGGAGSNNVFITSAAYELRPDQITHEPLAGSLFVATVDASGVNNRRVLL
jgi:sugar lactone lactonase YvrE